MIDAYFSVEEISFFDWVSNVLEMSQLGLILLGLCTNSLSIDPCDCALDVREQLSFDAWVDISFILSVFNDICFEFICV